MRKDCVIATLVQVGFINIGSILWPDVCLIQLWSPGQAGDLGQVAQRAAAVEGPTGIVPAQAAQLVLEIRVRQDGATPTHAQVYLVILWRELK